MCYSNHSHFFTLQQLRATTQAGGVRGVVLKAQGDAFFIEIEMRSGHYAVLVTARGKEPRRFKNPLRALSILRDIGIVHGQFDLSLYAPEQLNTHDKNATADLFTNTPRRSGSEPKRTTLTSPATQTEAEHTQPSLLGPTRTVKSKTPAPVPVAKSKGTGAGVLLFTVRVGPNRLGCVCSAKSKTPAPVPVAKSKGSSDNT